VVYAVVKAGGKQHKVAVGDVVEVNRLEGEAGDAVSLPALLLVDGRTVISEAAALAKTAVTGEIVGHHKGPKIKILKYKNKTGYRKRIGHRQLLTELLVTDIDDGKPKKAAKADTAKAAPAKATKGEAEDKPTKSASTKAASTKAESTKAESTKAESTKAESDDKPTKTAKTASAKAASAKTASAKAEPAKAEPKPARVTKAAKSAKATKAAETSKSSASTDDKED